MTNLRKVRRLAENCAKARDCGDLNRYVIRIHAALLDLCKEVETLNRAIANEKAEVKQKEMKMLIERENAQRWKATAEAAAYVVEVRSNANVQAMVDAELVRRESD